ncbi:MAG TPA: hypothetical protein VHE53_02760 [Patescibacteria group bacterium]|nr:hypothetical protein [Patescibacteria group bacterium]
MKLIVTHNACDLDAIASSWMIKRFLEGWENAEHRFVPAGTKLSGKYIREGDVIERVSFGDGEEADVIHVDTGLTPLDHHETSDDNVCATSRAFDYVLKNNEHLAKDENKLDALKRIVDYAVDDDHFQEVFYPNPTLKVYEFSIVSLIHGIKLLYPKDDLTTLNFGMDILDSMYHYLENLIWAEKEIKDKGIRFDTKWGKALAVESLNDTVLKLGQTMGYVVTVRKDPSTDNVRIKARPRKRSMNQESGIMNDSNLSQDQRSKIQELSFQDVDVDLTQAYDELKKMDPESSWYLHVSKRMLLNGSSKNPNMKGSKLTLDQVVEVLQNL